jgi:hypothetical protein
MSEDDDNEDDELKPRPRSPLQQRIADLMYNEGKSYSEAFDIVMGKKKPEPEPLYPPKKPKPQLSLENLNDLVAELNFEAEQIKLAKEELARLEEDVGKRNVKSIELNSKLEDRRVKLNEAVKSLKEKEKAYIGREAALKKQLEDLDKQKQEFNADVEAHKQKRKGFVKKISKSAESEFNEES